MTQLWCQCKATCKPTGATEEPNVPEDEDSGSPTRLSDPDDPGVLSRAGMAGGPRSLLLDYPRRGVSRLQDAFVGSLGQSSVRTLLRAPITFDWLGDRPPAGAGFVESLPIVPFPRGLGSQVNGLPPAPRILYGKTTRGAGGITVLDQPLAPAGTGAAPVSAVEGAIGGGGGAEAPSAPSGTWVSLGGIARRSVRPPTWSVKRVVAIDDSVRGVAGASEEPMEAGALDSPPLPGKDALSPGDGPAAAGPPGPSTAPFSAVTPPGGPDVIADGVFGSALEPSSPSALVPGQAQRPPQWLDPDGGRGPDFLDLLGGAATKARGADIFASGSVRSALGFRGKGGGGGSSRMDAPGATVAAAADIQRKLDDMFAAGHQVGKAYLVAAYGQARLEFDRMKAGKRWGKTFESATARERRRQDRAAALSAAVQEQADKSLIKRWSKREARLRPLSFDPGSKKHSAGLRQAVDRIRHWKAAVAGITRAREAKGYVTQQRALFLSLRNSKTIQKGAKPFPKLVQEVDEALRAAAVAAKTLEKASRDRLRLARGGSSQNQRDAAGVKQQAAQDKLDAALLHLAAKMAELWKRTHPPAPDAGSAPRDEDGNVSRTSIPFPPEICQVKDLCSCGSASKACDCADNEECLTCEKEWVQPPGVNGVKGLGDQVMAPGLLPKNQAQAIGGQIADIIRENIYFAGEAVVRSPADSPAGGLGGHGPSIAPFGSAAGAIPYYASPDDSPAGGGGKQQVKVFEPGSGEVDSSLRSSKRDLFSLTNWIPTKSDTRLSSGGGGTQQMKVFEPGSADVDPPLRSSKRDLFGLANWIPTKSDTRSSSPRAPFVEMSTVEDWPYELRNPWGGVNRMLAAGRLWERLPKGDPGRGAIRALHWLMEGGQRAIDEGATRAYDLLDRTIGGVVAGGAGLVSHSVADEIWLVAPTLAEDLRGYANASLDNSAKQFSLIDDALAGNRVAGEQVSVKRIGDSIVRLGVANIEASAEAITRAGVSYLRAQAADSSGEKAALFSELADTLEEFADSARGETSRSLSDAWRAFSTTSDITTGMSEDERLKHEILREFLNPVNWIGGTLAIKALEKFRRLLNLRRVARGKRFPPDAKSGGKPRCECPPKAGGTGSAPRGANPAIPRLPIPPTPRGMPTSEFGQLMKWGTGEADALAQIPKLTREGLLRDGVTREMAEGWGRFYRNEMLRVPSNESAPGRAVLMEAAARLLK